MLSRVLVFAFTISVIGFSTLATAQEAPAKGAEPAPKYRYWSTNWSFSDIDIRDLAGKLRAIGVEIPVQLAGRASVNFNVDVPINALRTSKAYRFRGSLQTRGLRADQVKFQSLDATVNFNNGVLTLSDLRGTQVSGKFTGTAKAELVPPGSFDTSLELTDIDASPIAALLAKFGIGSESQPVRAIVSAQVDASGKVDELDQFARWNVSGEANVEQLTVGNSMRYAASLKKFELKDQRLVIPDFSMTSLDLPDFFLAADGSARLDATGDFKINLAANDLPTTDLLGMYFASPESVVDGKIDFQGVAQGTFVPDQELPNLDVQLSLASPKMIVAGVDLGLLEHDFRLTNEMFELKPRQSGSQANEDLVITSASAKYKIEETFFSVDDLDMRLFGGSINATARLSRDGTGEHKIQSNWSELQPTFPIKLMGTRRVVVAGKTTGKIDWRVPADKLDAPQFHQGKIDVTIDPLRLGPESIGEITAKVDLSDSELQVDAKGKLLGGRLSIETSSPIPQQAKWSQILDRLLGEIRIENASLGKAIQAGYGKRTRFDGAFDAKVRVERMPGQPLLSRIDVTLSRLTSGRVLIARDIRMLAESEDFEINVQSVRGSYAGGRLDADGEWSFAGGRRLITARIVRADGDRVLLPINNDAGMWLDGDVTGRATIVGIGPGILDHLRISGSLSVNEAVAFNLPLGDAHTPFVVDVEMSPLHWTANFPVVNSQLAGGQVKGHLSFSNAVTPRGFDMDSDWRVNHVDFEKLLSTYAGTFTIGRGNVTGNFAIGGQNIRTANDIKGHFRVTLGGTDATALPGLSSDSLLGVTSLAGVSFSQGEASGRITRGSVVIDNMALTSKEAAFEASGRFAIFDKRLDIKARLTTGNFEGQTLSANQFGANQLMNLVPLGRINQLASNRVVVFKMAGPLRDPILRLLPGETARATAVRVLRQQVVGSITINSLLDN